MRLRDLFGRGRGAGSTASFTGSAEADPHAETPALDPRVGKFLEDFEQRRVGLTATGLVDYAACRDSVLGLHGDVEDEASRVELLRFHGALMSSGVDGLIREGRDPAQLEALWRSDYFSMLAKEVIDRNGDVDQPAVDRINRREQEAGRLADGEAFQVQPGAQQDDRSPNGWRSARAIGERAIALWTVVLRSLAPSQRETLVNAFAAEGSRAWMTGDEIDFLLQDEPNQKSITAFGWQAERLAVLLWSLGLIELPADDAKCDPIAFAPLIPPTSQVAFETFLASLRLRDEHEIALVSDRINTAYWAANEAEAEGRPAPAGTDIEILDERIRAIAWVGGQKVPDWP